MTDLSDLVKLARERRHSKVLNQCGTMRMLHVPKVIETTDIYTDVYILEDRPSKQWIEVSQLASSLNNVGESGKLSSAKFERFGLSDQQKRIPGLDVVSSNARLIILGKPGAGKTTFLKYLAVNSQKSSIFQTEYIPIFITLKDLAENIENSIAVQSSQSQLGNILQNHIEDELIECGISREKTAKILKEGRLFLLLDGLDEVPEQKDDELVKQLKNFFDKFYKNRFILTCRIATSKYRFSQEKFTEVEIADFNEKQAEAFISKWFSVIDKNALDSTNKGKSLIRKLKLPENEAIRDLIVTPILLNLICLVFKYTSDFPSNRADLYKDGLRILLYEWDEERRIKRDEVYHGLSLSSKEQLLGRLAALTFEKSNYFFKQEEAQQIIADYLRALYKKSKTVELILDSETVLKSIESQHGLLIERARRIYSFSHLTFHEYFTADYFLRNSNSTYLKQIIFGMIGRWREVFILLGGMLNNESHIRKIKVLADELVAEDREIQKFLIWVNQKSASVRTTIKPAAVRSFYFGLAFGGFGSNIPGGNHATWPFDFTLSRCIDSKLNDILFTNPSYTSELDICIDFASCCFAILGWHNPLKMIELEKMNWENSELKEFVLQLKNPIREPSISNLQEIKDLLGEVCTFLLDNAEVVHQFTHDQIKTLESLQDSELCKIDRDYRREGILNILEIASEIIDSPVYRHISNRDKRIMIEKIIDLRDVLSRVSEDYQKFNQKHQGLVVDTKKVLKKFRNIFFDWEFSDTQKEYLWVYYYTNILLINCLDNDSAIDPDFQEEIENSLLLPFDGSVQSNFSSNMAQTSTQRTQVFVSYSHQDSEWLTKLQKLLKPLIRNQNVILWDDTKIKPGAKWKEEIQKALRTTKVAVLLVSADFLNSDFIIDHELPPLLEAAEKEGLTILWVYISTCLYDATEIGSYQSAHTPLIPLDSLTSAEQQKVLTKICREIQKAIES